MKKDIELNSYIDHTILSPEAVKEDILRICKEAKEYSFCSVCTNSSWTSLVHDELKDSGVKTCAVVGFPLGAMSNRAKLAECLEAIKDGADEIDMVINIGRLKDGDDKYVEEEIRSLKEACGPKRVLKVIIETCLLTDREKVRACDLSINAGADFVKTSTGFSKAGAKATDVRLMREAVKDRAGVKASGGIHSREEALEMIEAGANRIGASSGIKIVEG